MLGGQHQLLVSPCWHWTTHMQPWLLASCHGLPAVPLMLHSMAATPAGTALTCWHCSVVPAQQPLWLQGNWWSRPQGESMLCLVELCCYYQQMPGAMHIWPSSFLGWL